jgi:hypothetical protein
MDDGWNNTSTALGILFRRTQSFSSLRLIHRDATTHERFDLPADVIRALARDGGEQIRP